MSTIVKIANAILFIVLLLGSFVVFYKLGRLTALVEVVEPIAAPTY